MQTDDIFDTLAERIELRRDVRRGNVQREKERNKERGGTRKRGCQEKERGVRGERKREKKRFLRHYDIL